jgi:glycine betaine/proline transport system ATP-binding protein
MNSPKVVVEGLCKVFGTNPKEALAMLAAGATKEEWVCQDRASRR